MLIVTNGLTDVEDEGFLKVANSLIRRMKAANSDTWIVAYERQSDRADQFLEVNKLLLNRKLISLIRKRGGAVLYIPFPAKMIATALRIFVLSLVAKRPVRVILVMKSAMDWMAKLLLRMSGVEIVVLSKDAENFYQTILSEERVLYLKTGVDTAKFTPVSPQRAKELKEKYGFDPNRPVVLHVGHLKYGRGVAELLKIDPSYQVLLVASTLTKNERDEALRRKLQSCTNVRIMDEYIPNIEEIYQLSDVYFFPVTTEGNCIDVPLSCLEAAACGKPVITTRYGEMREFEGKPGFFFVDEMNERKINELIGAALAGTAGETRTSVLAYDWQNAVCALLDQ